MSKNLGVFERAARLIGGSILLILSIFVFTHPVARLLIILFGLWGVLEGVSGACPFYHGLGITKPGPYKPETVLTLMVSGVQVMIGYIWWHAGWEKITSGEFMTRMPSVIAGFAADNPYTFVHNFLLNQGIKYADLFAFVIEFSQYLIGVVLIALTYTMLSTRIDATRRASQYLAVVAFGVGLLMNAVFYFAAGHTSPATTQLNVLMFWVQAIMIYGYINLLLQKPSRSRK